MEQFPFLMYDLSLWYDFCSARRGGQARTIVEGAHRAQHYVQALLRRLDRADSTTIDAANGNPAHYVPLAEDGGDKRH
jgi:hypothetical protein